MVFYIEDIFLLYVDIIISYYVGLTEHPMEKIPIGPDQKSAATSEVRWMIVASQK